MTEILKYAPTKAHQIYKTSDGKRVPGCTTVINGNLGWNTNVLVAWARREAMAGNDPTKIRDKAAGIGTLAHFMIECHWKGVKPDVSEFSQSDIDKAENCYLAFLEWLDKYKVKPIMVNGKALVEAQWVSNLYRYGGTCDLPCYVDDWPAIVDYKSGKGIYVEHKIQAAALAKLAMENRVFDNWPHLYCLKLGRDDGDFSFEGIKDLDKKERLWDVFKYCIDLHYLHKELK